MVFNGAMEEGLSMKDAIVRFPDDDSPRLIYADYLQDHGRTEEERARAEFIRLQCLVYKKEQEEDYAQEYIDLKVRENALWKKYKYAWIDPELASVFPAFLRGNAERTSQLLVQRGFIHAVRGSIRRILAHQEKLVAEPCVGLVANTIYHIHMLVRSSLIRQLRTLDLTDRYRYVMDGHLLDKPMQFLASGKRASNLRSLNLYGRSLATETLQEILESEHLTQLEEMDISHQPGTDVRTIARTNVRIPLRTLYADQTDTIFDDIEELIESPVPVTYLSVRHCNQLRRDAIRRTQLRKQAKAKGLEIRF